MNRTALVIHNALPFPLSAGWRHASSGVSIDVRVYSGFTHAPPRFFDLCPPLASDFRASAKIKMCSDDDRKYGDRD
jgi:hypothetical protein